MSIIVVDCSVAVKWFLPEPLSEAAVKIKASSNHLHVPDFFHLEFGSAVLKKARRNEISISQAAEMIRDIRTLPIQRHLDESLFPSAFQLASRTRTSLYDSMYLALAIGLTGRVVTADRRLLRSIAGTEYAHHALWIEDLPTP